MTEAFDLFRRAAECFGGHVHAVGADQWHSPTPDTEWDVRMLVNHVTVEQLWVPPLVGGKTVADVGEALDGDQLGDDPGAAWDSAVRESLASFGASGVLDTTVNLSSGERPTAEYLFEMTVDAFIHSWDLARAIGADETLDADMVAFVYEKTLPMADELQKTGLFAPPVAVADDASLQTKLLAIFGRAA